MSGFKNSSLTELSVDLEKMHKCFPVIIDDFTLASCLGIRNKTLWYLLHARNKLKAYKCFSIPAARDEDGKIIKRREIQEPIPTLKFVHSRLNRIFSKVDIAEEVTAYVRKRNCVAAAKRHLRPSFTFEVEEVSKNVFIPNAQEKRLIDDPRYKYVEIPKVPHDASSPVIRKYYQPLCMIKLDIKNFFPSIKASWIREYFHRDVGYSHYVSGLLASLCTVKRVIARPGKDPFEVRHLPQGSPLSGSLSNLVGFSRFGKRIKEFLKNQSTDWVMTIYSDDIILTHPSKTISDKEAHYVKSRIAVILREAGFKINGKKSLLRRSEHGRIRILGCIVTDKLNIPGEIRKRIGSTLYNCSKHGFESQCPSDKNVEGFIMYLQGMIEYIRSVKPELGDKYAKILQQAKEKYLTESDPDIIGGKLDLGEKNE